MNTGGIFLPYNGSSSTPGFQYYQFPTNVQENNRNNSTSPEIPPGYYDYLLEEIRDLKAEVSDLKQSSEKSKTFFKESVFLQRVCLAVIVLVPLILAAITAVVVWVFSTEAVLVGYAKWCLGILGVSGIAELIFIFATYKINVQRIEQIERRLDSLEKT